MDHAPYAERFWGEQRDAGVSAARRAAAGADASAALEAAVRAHATALFGSARAAQVELAGNVDYSGAGALLGGEGGVLRRLALVQPRSRDE